MPVHNICQLPLREHDRLQDNWEHLNLENNQQQLTFFRICNPLSLVLEKEPAFIKAIFLDCMIFIANIIFQRENTGQMF
jgi:hypothetical protein